MSNQTITQKPTLDFLSSGLVSSTEHIEHYLRLTSTKPERVQNHSYKPHGNDDTLSYVRGGVEIHRGFNYIDWDEVMNDLKSYHVSYPIDLDTDKNDVLNDLKLSVAKDQIVSSVDKFNTSPGRVQNFPYTPHVNDGVIKSLYRLMKLMELDTTPVIYYNKRRNTDV